MSQIDKTIHTGLRVIGDISGVDAVFSGGGQFAGQLVALTGIDSTGSIYLRTLGGTGSNSVQRIVKSSTTDQITYEDNTFEQLTDVSLVSMSNGDGLMWTPAGIVKGYDEVYTNYNLNYTFTVTSASGTSTYIPANLARSISLTRTASEGILGGRHIANIDLDNMETDTTVQSIIHFNIVNDLILGDPGDELVTQIRDSSDNVIWGNSYVRQALGGIDVTLLYQVGVGWTVLSERLHNEADGIGIIRRSDNPAGPTTAFYCTPMYPLKKYVLDISQNVGVASGAISNNYVDLDAIENIGVNTFIDIDIELYTSDNSETSSAIFRDSSDTTIYQAVCNASGVTKQRHVRLFYDVDKDQWYIIYHDDVTTLDTPTITD